MASEAARAPHHDYLGTGHILQGLIREHDGAAARALESFDVSEAVIDSRLTSGHGEPARSGHIPFTRHAKRTLDAARGGVTIGAWDRAPGCGPPTGSFVSQSTWSTMWCCR
ncbi:Clp protease N-terminal domain-containing protein [Rhodococcus koreensis]